MHKYEKILNLQKFDPVTKGRSVKFSCREFEVLRNADWIFTEKIDGMNIRVIFDHEGRFEVRGRTDKAQLKQDLVDNIHAMFSDVTLQNVTLYGEGYGPGIQTGACYRSNKSFILFDMFCHNSGNWFPFDTMAEIADDYEIPFVPVIARGTLLTGYGLVQRGLKSTFGDFWAEGLVGQPAVPLRGQHGQRIIVKIKHRDYYGKELHELGTD